MDAHDKGRLKKLGEYLVTAYEDDEFEIEAHDVTGEELASKTDAPLARRGCLPPCYRDRYTGQCICPAPKGRNALHTGDWHTVEKAPKAGERVRRTGWRPGIPDMRDFSSDARHLRSLGDGRAVRLADALNTYRSGAHKARNSAALPKAVDLREWCAEVEDQGDIGSCTAHAVVGLVEYYARRRGDSSFQGSRLFVYRAARRIAGLVGDSGAFIRSALGAAVMCGVPPEKYWPYTDDEYDFDQEPDNFVYSVAGNFQALSYFRYDPVSYMPKHRKELLKELKSGLQDELPFAFGFYGFPSFDHPDVVSGEIPFPADHEQAAWGHAIVAVGYDDNKTIANPVSGMKTLGAFLIRNSWGTDWGEDGYGWLPYEYVSHFLASDFWALVDMEWMATQDFGA